MNQPQPFQILKMDRRRGNIVVSRRAVMEETRAEDRTRLMGALSEGQVLDGVVNARAEEAARAALETVGLAHRAGHRPDELSGGEQQRGAIARALVTEPAIVLADEPTGALDSVNSRRVIELLMRLVAERRQTVILVTHDPGIAALAGRTIRMRDGQIESDQRNVSSVNASAPTPPLASSPAGAVSQ